MKPVILVVLDGWGLAPATSGNAITQASTPTIDKIESFYPATTLHASGISVGVPWGEPGNSEAGHLTLGAGRVVYQYLPKIILSIQDGSFFKNPAFLGAIEQVKKNNSTLHLMGLVSSASIHSYIDHLYALLELGVKEGISDRVVLHLFTDGRDSFPKEARTFLYNLNQRLLLQKSGKIATISGRSFGMDRDKNWQRTRRVYDCLVKGEGEKITDPLSYLDTSYARGITDEFIEPAVIVEDATHPPPGKPVGLVKEGDAIIFFNFREDRARQLSRAFIDDDFQEFPREKIKNLYFAAMTRYYKDIPSPVAFEKEEVKNSLGEVLSENGKKQLRLAETEKYVHVTYFFNGYREKPFGGEERIMIPSQGAPHFDQIPEMQAFPITQKLEEAIEKKNYDFILVNYANPDMIGHTGNLQACIKAVEVLDKCVDRILKAGISTHIILITADHGNCEEMIDLRTGKILTEHTANPVPFYLISSDFQTKIPRREKLDPEARAGGFLSDIAPTVLDIMRLKKPSSMQGTSLLGMLGIK